MSLNAKYYSVRQLSPFVGYIQIVDVDYCRALSSDGSNWQIQASCETHQQIWGISVNEYIPRRYVLYGSWSKSQGISTLPLDPMLDVPSLEHINNQLIHQLENMPALPFKPADHLECWLIDVTTKTPLALLASATSEVMIPHVRLQFWQAIPQQDAKRPFPDNLSLVDIQQLENYINTHTNETVWFNRNTQKNAQLPTGPNDLPADFQFPELIFNISLLPEHLQKIAAEFIRWQSPRLLSLRSLSPATRQQLEQQAQHYAIETHKRMSVYPQALNPKIHNKIMVELKLRG